MKRKAWTFLSNHGRIFTYLANHPKVTIQALAVKAGLSIRAISDILDDLEEEGYLNREKIGRANQYKINQKKPLRHRMEKNKSTDDLLAGLGIKTCKNEGNGNDLGNE